MKSENLKQVSDLLNSYKGPMQFEMNDYEFDKNEFYFLQYELYPSHNFKYESDTKKINFIKELGYPLSWEELFILCKSFRLKFKINKNDFVILLTYRKNSLNWFSHCDNKRNVFIHTGDWEHYIKGNHKFPVAYQVIENILQSLMKIDSTVIPNKYIHTDIRGCINDFCQDKGQIILKLRTADVCEDCLKRIFSKKIDRMVVDQSFQILEGLRSQFLFKKEINRIKGPVSIMVDEEFKIRIPQLGNIEIKLPPLFAALYILFLKNPQGIKLKELSDFKDDLKNLYKNLNVNVNQQRIDNSISDLIHPINSSFSQKKNKINKAIITQLGKSLSEYYKIIGNRGKPFKVNLSKSQIDIRF